MNFSPLMLPEPAEAVRLAHRQLIDELDLRIACLSAERFDGQLRCRPGCTSCCKPFAVLAVEAAIIAAALAASSQPPPATGDGESCLLLHRGLCTVYDLRPVICRTQGLPLGYPDEEAGTIEVSACPLNFTLEFPFTHDDLLLMDGFNRRLAEINLEYCRRAGLPPEQRIPLAELHRVSR